MTERDIQQRSARVAPLVAGDRVRFARELRGWTQRELVDATGDVLSAAALSQVEKGRTRPSPRTLVAIAVATGCEPEFFVARGEDGVPVGFFRSLRVASARDRRTHLARARLLHDFVDALEEYVSLPELDVPMFGPVGDNFDMERAAERLRMAWDLDDGPLPNVTRTVERHGILVVRVAAFKREVDAFSVNFDRRPIIVLGSEKAVTARSRFDASHELAHILLHGDEHASEPKTERQAHEFAAAFLMPASGIRHELPTRADWSTLMRLKARWRVSIQALLRRAYTLDVMTKQRYVGAMKTMSARGWRTNEPGDDALGPLEAPALLQLALDALQDVDLTWQEVASNASLPVDEVRMLIEGTKNPRPRVEL